MIIRSEQWLVLRSSSCECAVGRSKWYDGARHEKGRSYTDFEKRGAGAGGEHTVNLPRYSFECVCR